MKRIFTILLAALLAAAFTGCGSEAVTRPSAQRTKAESAVMRVEQLFTAYTERDMAGVIDKVSSDFEGGYGAFLGRLRKDMEAMEKVEMDYEIERVELLDGTIGVSVRWNGTWYPNDGKPAEGRGSSYLVFKDTEAIPLVNIVGDPPFGIIW